MKWILPLVLIFNIAYAECDFSFTPEQNSLLHLAYAVGQPHDLGYTMAAITWKESFVGRHIIRINPNDGKNGSYGVTHILLDTAMWMLDIDSTWEAKAELAPRLMRDDIFTLHLSLKYLLRFNHLPWRKQVERYNGQGDLARSYADDVTKRVNLLLKCKYFSQSIDNRNFVN
jgi:hypothetical protein